MKIAWTHRARARLWQIHAYIARDQPRNADAVVERVIYRVAQLGEHPFSGRVVAAYERNDLREIIESPYRIVYLVRVDRIEVVTVRDTRRLLPRNPAEL